MAALKGVDLDEQNDAPDRVEQLKREVEAEKRGVSKEALDLADFGLDIVEE